MGDTPTPAAPEPDAPVGHVSARETFVVAGEHGRRRIFAGTVVTADDPVVAGREALFVPVDVAAAEAAAAVERQAAGRKVARPRRKRTPRS